MNETTFLAIAVFVFSLLVIGLILTAIEFRRGEPRQQQKQADRDAQEPAARRPGVQSGD